jgi:GT2 family glycosyltransferase
MNAELVVSIVLYKNNPSVLSKAIQSVLESDGIILKLYLIDNSPTDTLRAITSDHRCTYIFNKRNIGFGAGHNIAMRHSLTESNYHLVLNPDVYFASNVLYDVHRFMEASPFVGQIMPQIRFPDNTIQYSGKLLPTPWDLIGRRLCWWLPSFKRRNSEYELQGADYNKIMNIPNQLGCFVLFRRQALVKAGLFDENIFMYLEDIDITRRVHRHYDTIYYPLVKIYHHYEKGSRRNPRLFLYHVKSAIYYFNKWGWFSDGERSLINRKVIERYQTHPRNVL